MTQGEIPPPAAAPAPPAIAPEARQFDFWIGDWDLTWGEGEQGTNRIRAILDGRVIEEQFDGRPATTLRGLSVSTYTPALGKWQQTWVDNEGSYLDFTGGWEAGPPARMVLTRSAIVQGTPVLQRMVWHHITPGTLDWNWERSADDGATWQTVWAIHYQRKPTANPGA
jgi:hypothetical protein